MKSILLCFMALLLACNSDEDCYPGSDQYYFNALAYFYILDKNGNDLLNPNTPNTLNTENIKIFYILDGKAVDVAQYHSDKGHKDMKYFSIRKPEGSRLNYTFWLAFATPDKGATATTLIQWSESDTDTIKVQFSRGDCSFAWTKFWYNGVEYSNKDSNEVGVYEIIK